MNMVHHTLSNIGSVAFTLLVMGLAILPLPRAANQLQAADAPYVPGIDRVSGTLAQQQILRGTVLLGELGCANCHRGSELVMSHLQPKRAPNLDAVGKRVHVDHLRAWIADPHAAKPGTTMPDVFAGLSAEAKSQKVESLVHFFAQSGAPIHTAPAQQAIKRGEQGFHRIGCAVCHGQLNSETPPTNAVPLGGLSQKYTIASLTQFLQDPLAVRPSGRMPPLNLNPEEARDIASYLLRDIKSAANLKYDYYEGNWDKLPDFASLKPQSSGEASGFDVNLGRPDNFALRFQGFLQVATEGEYRFHLGSDDGSRLLIDGKEIARMDGVHPLQFGMGRVKLAPGAHALVVEYFEGGGQQELRLEYEGPNLPRQSVEGALTVDEKPPGDDRKPFVVKPELAEAGKREFEQSGCKACHQPEPEQKGSVALTELRPQRGCMAEMPQGKAMSYHLSAAQRAAISAALGYLKQPNLAQPSPVDQVRRTVIAFNCVACHQRGELGGVDETHNALFTTTQPEMGDEGRIPPTLNGVGAKLREDWLRHLFDQGGHERPYMQVRMPRFGNANIGHLVTALGAADDEPPYERPDTESFNDTKLRAAGRHLTGSQGFSCIKCHTWGGTPSTGIQALSLTTMHRRLKEAWFHQYLLDPQIYRQGTRMPASWPNGQVLLPKVLDGKAMTQIHSVWRYLSGGDQATIPLGLGRDPIELVATTEPVIYRNFIEGSGPRSIGVGYPEKLNLSWDANDLRLALIWQGAFIDAARHWIDRGAGFQPPLGDNVIAMPTGPAWAVLAEANAAWPKESARTLGYRFRGYRFDEHRRPTFLYAVGDAQIAEHQEPVTRDGQAVLVRRISCGGSTPDGLYFRAAAGKITEQADGWYQVNSEWRTRVRSTSKPLLRTQGDRQELLVPASGKDMVIEQEIVW